MHAYQGDVPTSFTTLASDRDNSRARVAHQLAGAAQPATPAPALRSSAGAGDLLDQADELVTLPLDLGTS